MTDTKRTTVTLTTNYMKKVEELIDVYAPTKAQVISKIVENFFDDPDNLTLLEKLREEKQKLLEQKRKKKYKHSEVIEEKIDNILKAADRIPISHFLKYLKIDIDYFFDKLPDWQEKFHIFYENDKIKKRK
ncbi:MAG: hypothetical protein R6U96_11910 [Promethearchaeia archaeon]